MSDEEIRGRFDQVDGRLNAVEQRLDGVDRRLDGVDRRLDAIQEQMAAMKDELIERMRDMQTEIIKVFMSFQERNESRDVAQEQATAALSARVSMMEHRILEIEKKLLLNPPSA